MELNYHIGGFVFQIIGDSSSIFLDINGLEYFKTTSKEPNFTLRLVEQLAVLEEEKLLYNSDIDHVLYRLAVDKKGSYQFRMIPSDNRPPLLLRYHPNKSYCEISGSPQPDFLRFAFWMAFGFFTAGSAIAIHSSTVIYKDRAVMFLGESGTGKSTHTRLWTTYIPKTTLLNDDSPILSISEDTPYVYGSPWSGKTPCYRNERIKLAAIVRLSQAPYNKIEKLSILNAFGALYPSCPPAFALDKEFTNKICSLLSKTLAQIPVYHLSCLPNKEAALLSFNTIFHSNQ